ncbi:MAG TPA: hypothetical protein PLP19_08255 [bacterium]|nr:hypothetical protein [bacterium]HPN43465.1 hypothetical protein [bacterium]
MLHHTLLITAAIFLIFWGTGHLLPTRAIVKGFKNISRDNKYIITMAWLCEGLLLIYIGVMLILIMLFADIFNPVAILFYRASAVLLLVLSIVTLLTGAKTPVLPIKLCPIVKTFCAVLLILASIL